MWKNISNLWDKPNQNTNVINTPINMDELMNLMDNNSIQNNKNIQNNIVEELNKNKEVKSDDFILTDRSQRFSKPRECPIDLWPH